MKFCTYITFYKGNLLPPFYIGYTSVSNIKNNNYHGSVASEEYSKIWKNEIRNNNHLFKTKILTLHETRKEAKEKETYFQTFFKVHKNPMYVNRSISGERFYKEGPLSTNHKKKISESTKGKKKSVEHCQRISKGLTGKEKSKEHKQRISETKQDDNWKNTTGKSAKEKEKTTKSSQRWLDEVGYKTFQRSSDIQNDPTWKETIGKKKKIKELKTKSSTEWLKKTGYKAYEKMKSTKNSDEWKSTKGKIMSKKLSEIQNDLQWKMKHNKTCEYCGKGPISIGNYKRWHGENCKFR